MGGIAGVVGSRDRNLAVKMVSALQHRGPDNEGYYSSDDTHLGAHRLGINDLRLGAQPIYNETQDMCVVCDGEIYNHRELRQELLAKGHKSRSTSDTETIIHLYEEYGDDCVQRLRGMFAFAVVQGDTLLLARDRLGIKPLYYAFLKEKNLFLFASEIKALLQCDELAPELDEETMTDLVVPRFLVGNRTFLKGIKTVRPGHILKVTKRDGQIHLSELEYFRLSFHPDEDMSLDYASERLSAILINTVESHFQADAEVGLALSGGLDSTLIALIAHKYHSKRIVTFTLSSGPDYQDMKMARAIAGSINSDHHEVIINFEDYLNSIPLYMEAMESPVLSLGVPFYLLCREAARRVKVCLIGEGADSLFGGSADYLDGTRRIQYLERGLAKARELGLTIRSEVSDIVSRLCNARDFNQYVERLFRSHLRDSLIQGFHYYDRCSMSLGLELRDPYVGDELVEFLSVVPTELKVRRDLLIGKYILRYTALRMFGTSIMDAVLRRKIGLGNCGLQFSTKFADMCDSNIPDSFVNEHRFGAYFSRKQDLLLFDLFQFIFIENRGRCPNGLDVFQFIKDRSHIAGHKEHIAETRSN